MFNIRFGFPLDFRNIRFTVLSEEICDIRYLPCDIWRTTMGFFDKCLYISWANIPDSKVHGANIGPTWVLSAPDGPHVGPNLANRDGV